VHIYNGETKLLETRHVPMHGAQSSVQPAEAD
jgi:hypothetical protein